MTTIALIVAILGLIVLAIAPLTYIHLEEGDRIRTLQKLLDDHTTRYPSED